MQKKNTLKIKIPHIVLSFTVIFSLVLVSCRSTKNIVQQTRKVENLSTNKLLDSISAYCFKFEYFSSKISTEAKAGELDKSFKTNLKMRQDSAIWMTFTVANFVGASAIITLDSVKVLNKLDKKYFKGDFNYINEMFNTELDFFMLQDILVGNLVNFDPNAKYKMKEDTAYYFISTVGKRKLRRTFEHERLQKKEPFVYRYWINPGTYRPARMIINDLSDSTSLEVIYRNYELVDSVLVPSEIFILATSPGKEATIELIFSRSKVNEFTEFPFKIPEGYEKME